MEEVFERYASVVDALVLAWWTGDGDEGWSKTLLEPFARVATRSKIPFVVSPVEATGTGAWVDGWRERGLVFTRGIQSTYRALAALDQSCAQRVRGVISHRPSGTGQRPPLITSQVGPIVGFADAMMILASVGITVAPYVIVDGGPIDSVDLAGLGDRLVVKLADVAHRTELGAVPTFAVSTRGRWTRSRP